MPKFFKKKIGFEGFFIYFIYLLTIYFISFYLCLKSEQNNSFENFVQNNNNPCFFLLTLQLIKNKIYLIRNKLQHPYFLILIIVEFCNCLLSLIFSNIIVTLHRLTILQYYGKIVAKCWSLISFNYTRNSIHFNKII